MRFNTFRGCCFQLSIIMRRSYSATRNLTGITKLKSSITACIWGLVPPLEPLPLPDVEFCLCMGRRDFSMDGLRRKELLR